MWELRQRRRLLCVSGVHRVLIFGVRDSRVLWNPGPAVYFVHDVLIFGVRDSGVLWIPEPAVRFVQDVLVFAVPDSSVLWNPGPAVRIVFIPSVELMFCLAVPHGKLRERGRELQLSVVSDVLVDAVRDPRLPEWRGDQRQNLRRVS